MEKSKYNIELDIENFLGIRKANLKSDNNLTVLIAPNKAGKTQILYLIYSILNAGKNTEYIYVSPDARRLYDVALTDKFMDVFGLQLAELKNLHNYKRKSEFKISFSMQDNALKIDGLRKPSKLRIASELLLNLSLDNYYNNFYRQMRVLYISPADLVHYRGIKTLTHFYKDSKLVSSAIYDIINELSIVSGSNPGEKYKDELHFFFKLFDIEYIMADLSIQVKEGDKWLNFNKVASGLKSLSWYYLIMKYNILGDFLLVDEPEVNLHPVYIDKLAEFFAYLAKRGKKLFISTHSDYFLESLNKHVIKGELDVDVWNGKLEKEGAVYEHYVADKDNLIKTKPLNETYNKIVKELFESE